MPSRPHETVFLKPTQQQPESGAIVQQELDAIAFTVVEPGRSVETPPVLVA
jgi:hypothetical protein